MNIYDRLGVPLIGLVSAVAFAFLVWLIYFSPPLWQASPQLLAKMPAFNCVLNACSALALIAGLRAILKKNKTLHQRWMVTAFLFSTVFLVAYLVYHSAHGDTPFLGTGWLRTLYFFVLISHIGCTIVGLPLILTTFFFAWRKRFATHKKIARVTFPLWLYISVTGVLVYVIQQLV